ncbi:hypothetical protein AQUCO_01700096v1 [Aquilegia coerulea]|uniref:FBD domain-containing protein n=1 Tax=Aquilegia coerulea TaxID=218851 RepID=A0A2G5DL77_AQUCA|nr:hypothetical protein AQUCO_01700096v1 [Aquilegia coerulea]
MGLHNVGTLRLRGYEIELLTRVQNLSACLPSPCRGLKHLYLTIDPTKNQFLVITFLLKSYPNLQNLWLCFNEEKRMSLNMVCMEEHWHSEEWSAEYVLKYLRMVEIKQFQGSESELEFVKYFLENANMLEYVNIGFSCKEKVIEERTSITEKLLTFARVSPHAQIFLS